MKRLILACAFALLAAPAAAQAGANVCPSAETAHALGAKSMRYADETEKSLNLVFADARVTVRYETLLFDEAESLFGRRTDVRDASDRYAKQDIAYLLAYRAQARPVVLDAFPRRAFAAGFTTASRNAGLIVIETETGVATLEIRGLVSERAVALARAVTKTCGVR